MAVGGGLGLAVLALAVALLSNCAAFGYSADGARKARMEASPQWGGETFQNPEPLWNNMSVTSMYRAIRAASDYGTPKNPAQSISVMPINPSRFRDATRHWLACHLDGTFQPPYRGGWQTNPNRSDLGSAVLSVFVGGSQTVLRTTHQP